MMTRAAAWKRVMPSAYAPSRNALGTARIASSLIDTT
jgi:hypothetical protein